MANLLDIRRRIRSVINTRQITKAMKMVSAARLRRAQERALSARPYSQMLTNVLQSLTKRTEIYDPETGEARHPLLARREENKILVVVVTGVRGLAGAFNTNIAKATLRFLDTKAGKTIDIETVGRKGRDFLKRRYPSDGDTRRDGIRLGADHSAALAKAEFNTAEEIAQSIIKRYTRGEIDSVYLIYNEFKSVIAQRLVVDEILPIDEIGVADIRMVEETGGDERKRRVEAAATAGVSVHEADTRHIDERAAQIATADVDYIYEQPADELFHSLLPKYVALQIHRAMMESVAAEHAARMTAMDAATNNASDMIDSLTLQMNRIRQAKITKEIIEIVSGAAAQ